MKIRGVPNTVRGTAAPDATVRKDGKAAPRDEPSQKTGPAEDGHPQGRAERLVAYRKGQAMLARATGNAFEQTARDAVYRTIFTRRDVRSDFSGETLDDAVLARLLSAAHHAPSVGFMQPWNFIVIRDLGTRQAVRDLFLAARQSEETHIAADRQELYRKLRLEGICESTLNICITCDRSRAEDSPLGRWHNPEMDIFSTVCAVQNFWLAARAEGIGVGWVSILDRTALKSLLAMPDQVVPVAYLCVGPVAAFAGAPDLEKKGWRKRLPLAGLVMSERFGGDGETALKAEIEDLTVER